VIPKRTDALINLREYKFTIDNPLKFNYITTEIMFLRGSVIPYNRRALNTPEHKHEYGTPPLYTRTKYRS